LHSKKEILNNKKINLTPFPKKTLNKKFYSTISVGRNLELNPFFVSGFTDAEGSFTISVIKSKENKIG
jgi:hypothetical protein